MGEDLFAVAGRRRLEAHPCAQAGFGDVVAGPHRVGLGHQLAGLVQQREAQVDVVENHQRRGRRPQVFHPVLDGQPALAQPGGDAAGQAQVLAEQAGLPHLPLHPEAALVALPFFAHLDVARRQQRQPAMQAQRLSLVLVGSAQVGQPAAGQQAAAEGAQPAEAFRLEVRRMGEAGRREPGQRQPAVGRRPDVHAPVEQHGEVEPGAGAHLRQAHAALGAVVPLGEPDAGQLRQVADAGQQLRTRPLTIQQTSHFTPPTLIRVVSRPLSAL